MNVNSFEWTFTFENCNIELEIFRFLQNVFILISFYYFFFFYYFGLRIWHVTLIKWNFWCAALILHTLLVSRFIFVLRFVQLACSFLKKICKVTCTDFLKSSINSQDRQKLPRSFLTYVAVFGSSVSSYLTPSLSKHMLTRHFRKLKCID